MILIQTSIYYFFSTFKEKKMQFSPHPLLFFIFLIISFIPSFSLSNSAPSQYSNCAPLPYRCGDTTFTISYPFHIDARPSYCGNPDYYINCTNMNTTLAVTISNQQYQITSIDYNNNLLNIVNKDFISDTGCPQDFTNTTINTNLYQYSQRDRNLTVYINCTGPVPIIPVIANYACLDFSGHSYYRLDNGTLDDFFGKCSSTIIVPLGQETANNLVNGKLQFKQALQQGFFLEWTAGWDWCGSCVNSGGYCGYNVTDIHQHTCFCPNGTSAGFCDSLGEKTHTTKKIVIGVACGFGGFLLACAGCFYFYRRKLKKHKDTAMIPVKSVHSKSSSNKDMESISFNCNTPLFSYEELVEATNGFESSRELGDGGYGTVYKGVLKDGRVVAVKRLYETSYKRVEQFMNEVEILSGLRHPNLVTLYGSTSPNSPHLLLVYEFIPNGTLADHLHTTRSKSLSLCLRLKMAIDTAASLSYLHSIDIIHRDVKSNNILVDNNFNVKVADFGLSRLFPPNRTHVSTAPQGTPGYLDPEYHRFYQLTDKSDVYSFGVVLMEFIASRPAVDIDRKPNEISLAMAAVSKIQKGELSDLIDPYLRFNSNQGANRIITQIAELAFRCLQMDREMRPSIKEVLKELKEIEGAHFDYEEDCCEKKMREEATLLNKSEPGSPESISCTWTSRSTTPSASN